MKTGKRLVLILLALLLVSAGAMGAWFAVTIPNDLKAESLLKDARTAVKEDRRPEARTKLETIVREHPRTDAAAVAAQTLFHMDAQERDAMDKRLAAVERARQDDRRRVTALEAKLNALASRPAPVVAVPKPPPPKPKIVARKSSARKAPVRKAPAKKRRR